MPAPNVHEDPQSSGTTVDAQSSTSLMPSPQVENLPPSQAKIERLKNRIQTLRLQLQLAEQELQQITQGDQVRHSFSNDFLLCSHSAVVHNTKFFKFHSP